MGDDCGLLVEGEGARGAFSTGQLRHLGMFFALAPALLSLPSPAADTSSLTPQLAKASAPEISTACYEDANLGENQCGGEVMATCTGSNGLGPCCSVSGWCGSDVNFCGENGLGA